MTAQHATRPVIEVWARAWGQPEQRLSSHDDVQDAREAAAGYAHCGHRRIEVWEDGERIERWEARA